MHLSRLAAIYWYMVTISMRYISRAERAGDDAGYDAAKNQVKDIDRR